MNTPHPFSCFVIGETSLALQCCEKLIERGHSITGIVSPHPDISAWAANRGIMHATSLQHLNAMLRDRSVEYLFSIVNNAVLSPETLGLPRRMAINFHDAPLPRYGGIHATSWAIINREQQHGITWHGMTPQIDGGAILKQKIFPVHPTDTALTLNLRCYQKALEAFDELIEDLAAGTVSSVPQDLSQRTYVGRYRRPDRGCLIDWNASAAEIEACVRGLDFGPYPNALGTPKIRIGADFYIVNRLRILENRSTALPGTVLTADNTGISVSSMDFNVLITGVTTIEGTPCDIPSPAIQGGIRPGYRLIPANNRPDIRLTELYQRAGRHESFWQAELSNIQPTALPDMRLHARSCVTPTVLLHTLPIPPALISAASNSLPGTKPWHILCAVFAAFLARHIGTDHIHLGLHDADIDDRIQGLEGFFSGCLPLLLDIDVQAPLSEICRSVIDKLSLIGRSGFYCRDVFARYPDLSRRSGLRLPMRVRHALTLDGLQCSLDADLEIALTDQGDCLLHIDTSAVDPAYAESFRQQLSTFIDQAASGFTEPVERLAIAGDTLNRTILETWNDTATPFDNDVCIHELFERRASMQPGSIATVFENTERTYAELNHRANNLAWKLKQSGVGRGTVVGVCLDRGHEMIEALLAILKAGGAYVPLDPAYPVERIATIVRSADIHYLVSQMRHAERTSHTGVHTWMLDGPAPAGDTIHTPVNPPRTAGPDDPAYIIYTSGSTGTPKGVMVAHRAFINLFEWCCDTFGFGPHDCVLFTTALGFDLSVFDIFGMLGCGGKIYIAGDAERRDGVRLARTLCTAEITFWDSAPAALQLLVPALAAQARPVQNTRLRLIFLSGDWIPLTLPDDVRAVFPGAQVISLGGATEATVWSNFFPVDCVQPFWRSIPYGRPIHNSRYYILDGFKKPCPPGVIGDLFIAGECLSMGYRNEPELTRTSFPRDPFQLNASARMYRTGDRARFFPDGTMEFCGRSDFQVKVRGYRIELGEIEHVLRRHAAVKDAVAAVQTGAAGDQKIVAYLTSANVPAPDSIEMRRHAASYLSEYMVPNVFVWLDAMPVSANGKLDRPQLPWPVDNSGLAHSVAPVSAQPAGTDLEAELRTIFCDVLGLQDIEPTADFFDLGVTSLNLVHIAEQLNTAFSYALPVETLLDHPSIKALAAVVRQHMPFSAVAPAAGPSPPAGQSGTPQQPVSGVPAASPHANRIHDIFSKIHIQLPVEALIDDAVRNELITRIRQVFPVSHISAGTHHADAAGALQDSTVTAHPAHDQTSAQPSAYEYLAEAFTNILRITDITHDTDFFDLGVTSLNLIEIAEYLEKRHKISVPVEAFLEHTTLTRLAAYIHKQQSAAAGTAPGVLLHAPSFSECPAGVPLVSGSHSRERIQLPTAGHTPGVSDAGSLPSGFGRDRVSLRSLSRLLGLLKQESVQNQPRYLYPSAGGLHAVQTYVCIRSGRVDKLDEGIYYYHPVRHQLIAVHRGPAIPLADLKVFDESGFCLFFVAQLAALQPVYAALSPALAVLDAGYMIQLLMSHQKITGIGLCPLAGVDVDRMKSLFGLDPTHLYLCCLAGGVSAAAPAASSLHLSVRDTDRHVAAPAFDWECLKAVAVSRLDNLNAMTSQAHEQLHRSEPHLRRFSANTPACSLPPVSFLHNQYLLRSTQRSFSRRTLSLGVFSHFMALLKRQQIDDKLQTMYYEPAGSGAMQILVHITSGAVAGITEGAYRYDQVDHALDLISHAAASNVRQAHFPSNRTYFSSAGFSIYCIARTDVLEPLYGQQGLLPVMLESGCIGQVLMDHQARFGLGVCPIGALRFDGLKAIFGLGAHHVLLHSFICGPVDRDQNVTGQASLKLN